MKIESANLAQSAYNCGKTSYGEIGSPRSTNTRKYVDLGSLSSQPYMGTMNIRRKWKEPIDHNTHHMQIGLLKIWALTSTICPISAHAWTGFLSWLYSQHVWWCEMVRLWLIIIIENRRFPAGDKRIRAQSLHTDAEDAIHWRMLIVPVTH